jgi:hypothetical protein
MNYIMLVRQEAPPLNELQVTTTPTAPPVNELQDATTPRRNSKKKNAKSTDQ